MDEPWPDDAVRDRLIGDWHIYQRKGGHRTSTDDVITAWHACRGWSTPPKRYLDLGCGIGSVLLTVAWRLRPDWSVGVEAQTQSVCLLQRSLEELPDAPEIRVRQSDFRSLKLNEFDLITGSPPYFPLGTGMPPSDPQRLACRFETRGGVEDYCVTAARHLSELGRFHLVFQSKWTERVQAAGTAAGLHLVHRCDFLSRIDRPEPFLTVYEFRRTPVSLETMQLAVRDVDGEFTSAFTELRTQLGH